MAAHWLPDPPRSFCRGRWQAQRHRCIRAAGNLALWRSFIWPPLKSTRREFTRSFRLRHPRRSQCLVDVTQPALAGVWQVNQSTEVALSHPRNRSLPVYLSQSIYIRTVNHSDSARDNAEVPDLQTDPLYPVPTDQASARAAPGSAGGVRTRRARDPRSVPVSDQLAG